MCHAETCREILDQNLFTSIQVNDLGMAFHTSLVIVKRGISRQFRQKHKMEYYVICLKRINGSWIVLMNLGRNSKVMVVPSILIPDYYVNHLQIFSQILHQLLFHFGTA